MELLTRPLRDALAQLKTHMALTESPLAAGDVVVKKAFRTAAIQSFEFTYALGVKMIDRVVMDASPDPAALEEMEFQTRMRIAWERGFVRSAEEWVSWRAYRNLTSHAYREDKAMEVYAVLAGFVDAVAHLLAKAEETAHAR